MFYIGNNGNFDHIVQAVLEKISSENNDVRYCIVLSRLDERIDKEKMHRTIFPESLEGALPRFAISKRNDWMIKECGADIV